jgi:hypothetical protein
MARRPVGGLARRRSTKETWSRENGTSGIRPPSKSSRTSSLEIPTLVMTTTAARSCTLCTAEAGVPKVAPRHWLRSTTISFGASDCPENMAGAGILPLITALVIANMRLHHVLFDGGAGLNVISHAAFKQLQIPGSRLGPSRPFSGVGPQPVYPLGSITLPVTFGTEENFRIENIQFDVAKVNLPFNAIIGRSALYRFMAIAHYGYLVLKMPSPAEVLTVRGDRPAALAAIEKLHALAAETARPDDTGRDPLTSCTKTPAKVPKVQPSGADGVPIKTIQLSVDSP